MSESQPPQAAAFVADVTWKIRDVVIGFAMVAVSLLALGLILVISSPHPIGVAILAIASGLPMLLVVWILAVRKYRISWASVGLRLPAQGKSYWFAPAALFASLMMTALYALGVTALGIDLLIPQEPPPEIFGDGFSKIAVAVAVAGFVPFAEELFFRGFVFGGIAARYGVGIGAVSSSAIFALAHIAPGSIIPILFTGIIFAWAYTKTRSLWIPILAHMGQNLLAVSFAGAG